MAQRPVSGGAYTGPRSEPGGQNTPRTGRFAGAMGLYTSGLSLLAQQVDQGLIFDDTADAAAIVTADGTGLEDYAYPDSGSGTVTADGTGSDTYAASETATGTVTATGTGSDTYSVLTYYDTVIDADSPVSHWKLGDTTTATDRKGTLNLPAVSGPISTASGLITNNASDQGNTFTSTQRFGLNNATNRGAPYNTVNWTIETWIKPGALGAIQYALRRSGLAAQVIYVTAGGTLRFEFNGNSAGQILQLISPVTIGTTYHVVATYDGTNVIAYLNGVEKIRRAITTTGSSPNDAPTIGSENDGANPFTGTVDEAAWYPAALTAARVLAHYQAGTIPAGTVYTDTGSGTLTASGTATEAAAYTDSATAPLTAAGTGTDSRSYTDTAAGTATATGTGTDSWTTGTVYTDTGAGTTTAGGTGTETATTTDTSTGTATSSGTGTESQARSSSATGLVTASGTSTEAAAAADAQSGTITIAGSGTDTWIRGYLDAGTGTTTASGTSTDSYATDDTATGTLTATGSGPEAHADTDAGTATTTATGSGLETYLPGPTVHTDTGTGQTTLTGTGAEAYSYTDTAAGLLTLTAASTESHGYTDSSTGETTLTGSGLEDRTYTDSTLGLALITGAGISSSTPRQLAVSVLTLNQPTYNIAIQNGNMATTLTATAAPTIRIIAIPSITTSIQPPTPISIELDRIT